MGFFDFLVGRGGRSYNRLLGWTERKVGKAQSAMSDFEIEQYVTRMRTAGPTISEKTINSFKLFLKQKYGIKP